MPWLGRALPLHLSLLFLPSLACSPLDDAPLGRSIRSEPSGAREVGARPAGGSASLRAASIRSAQESASPSHDWSREGEVHLGGTRGRVSASGLEVSSEEGWSLTLSAVRLGREGAVSTLPEPELDLWRNDARLLRPGLTERWVAGPLGLEHLFELTRRPDGEGELAFELEALGLTPSLEDGGVALSDGGGVRARYAELFVQDAEGRSLPARLDVLGPVVRIRVDDGEARYPITVDPLLVTAPGTILAGTRWNGPFDDGNRRDRFGTAVAIHGDTALIGAPYAYMPPLGSFVGGSGSAYFFERSGGVWTQIQDTRTFNADNLTGSSVALEANTALIGAPGQMQAAFVLVRGAPFWSLQATLRDPGTVSERQDEVGASVALSGDTALVGGPGFNDGVGTAMPRFGVVFVYVRSGTTWTQQARLQAADRAGGDEFGRSVALDGDTALVGARLDSTTRGASAGSAYVFVRSGNTWTQVAKLEAADGAANDNFGASVALRGGRALVGAPLVDGPAGADTGAVYAFVQQGSVWAPEPRLLANDPIPTARFGSSVAIDGDVAVVGSSGADSMGVGGFNASGGAYLFLRGANGWGDQTRVTLAPARQLGAGAGASVALHGRTALVGAPNMAGVDVWLDPEAGGVYAYSWSRPNGTPCSAGTECSSGFCADGVCCDSACGASATDCQACSIAAGAASDGVCGPSSGNACTGGAACTTTNVCGAGSCGCSACPAGTFSADGTGATPCVAWTTCAVGTSVASEGSSTTDRTCSPCQGGTFSAGVNALACTAWTSCGETEFETQPPSATSDRLCAALTECAIGEYVSSPASATMDRTCASCPAESFSSSSNAIACAPWTSCLAGTSVSIEGSTVRDRACVACPGGMYSAQPNAPSCTPWTPCTSSQYEATPGSASRDRSCAAVTTCGPETFEAAPPTATTDRSCVARTQCAPGTRVSSPGSPTADRTCSPCAGGQFSSATNAPSCEPWRDCAPGTFVMAAGTATADRTCAQCAPGTYASGTNLPACEAWTVCGSDEYEAEAPSASRDRTCRALTLCRPGEFESSAPLPTRDRECSACKVCGGGEIEAAPCGLDRDTLCAPAADAGVRADGGGPPPSDSGVPSVPTADAGSADASRADAGTRPAEPLGSEPASGCTSAGRAAGSPPSGVALLALGALLVVRRRASSGVAARRTEGMSARVEQDRGAA
jgi:MYXO-CTERM domain-containing protein